MWYKLHYLHILCSEMCRFNALCVYYTKPGDTCKLGPKANRPVLQCSFLWVSTSTDSNLWQKRRNCFMILYSVGLIFIIQSIFSSFPTNDFIPFHNGGPILVGGVQYCIPVFCIWSTECTLIVYLLRHEWHFWGCTPSTSLKQGRLKILWEHSPLPIVF